MPKLIFQVFNNFSLFCISAINRSDVQKSGFVLGAGMCTHTQDGGRRALAGFRWHREVKMSF